MGRGIYCGRGQPAGQSRPAKSKSGEPLPQGERTAGPRNGGYRGFSLGLIRMALIRQSSDKNVYISARKSMTIRFYLHFATKRAKAITLLDLGATENFMDLTYARWMKLPIKSMPHPRKLYNIDGMENKAGEVKFFVDLGTRTGTSVTNLRFFLSDLGGQKAILGYPWFANVQPRIDWKRGWIDQQHLLIIFKATNAQKAKFLSRKENRPRPTNENCYYIGSVTIHPANPERKDDGEAIPREYHRHKKVFDEESSQRLPRHTIWDHAIELLPNAPATLP